MVIGLIIVEKCRVEVESTEGNRNGFRLSETCVCLCRGMLVVLKLHTKEIGMFIFFSLSLSSV